MAMGLASGYPNSVAGSARALADIAGLNASSNNNGHKTHRSSRCQKTRANVYVAYTLTLAFRGGSNTPAQHLAGRTRNRRSTMRAAFDVGTCSSSWLIGCLTPLLSHYCLYVFRPWIPAFAEFLQQFVLGNFFALWIHNPGPKIGERRTGC